MEKIIQQEFNWSKKTEIDSFLIPPIDPELIRDGQGIRNFQAFLDQKKPKAFFVDSETTGLDPFSDALILISVLCGTKAFLFHLAKMDKEGRFFLSKILQNLLEDPEAVKVFHNGKFDLKFFKQKLFPGKKMLIQNLFDTCLAEQILMAGIWGKGDLRLKDLAKKYLALNLDKSEQKTFTLGDLSQNQIEYASKDVLILDPIYQKQSEALKKAGLLDVASLEFSIIPAVADLELSGMMIDLKKLEIKKRKYEDQNKEKEEALRDLVKGQGVNFNSPIQVKKIFSGLGIEVESTGTESLAKVDHPLAKALVEYRKVTKLLTSFVYKLPSHIHPLTGRIHSEFAQLGTQTGRFTCQKPNLQQIPKEQAWRDLFIAREGYSILTADYNQIELRILAEYSQDETFLEAYGKGEDLHRKTAAEIFKIPADQVKKDQRNIAKTINFGLCYGMTAHGLSMKLKSSEEKAEDFMVSYFSAYPKVKDTLQDLEVEAILSNHSKTLSGRKRYYPAGESNGIERKGRNTPIQGTCGDIIKKAIQYLMKDLMPYEARIINLVHDELVIEVKGDQAEKVREIVERDMIQAGRDFLKTVPVTVESVIDKAWRK